jgi:hypothetical protein
MLTYSRCFADYTRQRLPIPAGGECMRGYNK